MSGWALEFVPSSVAEVRAAKPEGSPRARGRFPSSSTKFLSA